MKGRLNGKPIRIAANPTPFDQSESHFVEAALYDEVAPAGEASLAKLVGIPLPKWEEIKDAPKADLRDLLERKRKRRTEASTSKSQPQCVRVRLPDGRTITAYEGARGPIIPNKRLPNQKRESCSPHVLQ